MTKYDELREELEFVFGCIEYTDPYQTGRDMITHCHVFGIEPDDPELQNIIEEFQLGL